MTLRMLCVACMVTLAMSVGSVQAQVSEELPPEVATALAMTADEIAALEPNPSWDALGLFSEDSLRILEAATTDRPVITYAFGDDPTGTPVFVPDGATPVGSGAMYWQMPDAWVPPTSGWGSDVAFAQTAASQLQPGDTFLLLWMEMDGDYDFSSPRQVNEGFPLALPGLPVWNSAFAGDTWEGANLIPNAIYDNGILTLDVKQYQPPQSFPLVDVPAFYYRSGNIMAMGVSADALLALAGDTAVAAGDEGTTRSLLYTGGDTATLAQDFVSALDELLHEIEWFGWSHITEDGQFTPGFIAYLIETYGPLETLIALNTVVAWFGPPPVESQPEPEDDEEVVEEADDPEPAVVEEEATETEDPPPELPTEPTTVSTGDDGGLPLVLIGLGIVTILVAIFGLRKWFSPGGTRTRDPDGGGTGTRGGDDEEDDGEDVRDVPVPIYGEVPEEPEHVCDWELWVVTETPILSRPKSKFTRLEDEVRLAEQDDELELQEAMGAVDRDVEVVTVGDSQVVRTRVREATEGTACCSAEIRIKTRVRTKTSLEYDEGTMLDDLFTKSEVVRLQRFLSRDRRHKAGNGARYRTRQYEHLANVSQVGLGGWTEASTKNSTSYGHVEVAEIADELLEQTNGEWDFTPAPPEGAVMPAGEPDSERGREPAASDVLAALAKSLKAKLGAPTVRTVELRSVLCEDTDIEVLYNIHCPAQSEPNQRVTVEYGGNVSHNVENTCAEHGLSLDCDQILEAGAWAGGELAIQGVTVDVTQPVGPGSQIEADKGKPMTKDNVTAFLAEAAKTYADIKGHKVVALDVGRDADQSKVHNKKTGSAEPINGPKRSEDRNSVVVTWTSELATAVKAKLDDSDNSIGENDVRNASASARADVFLNIKGRRLRHNGHAGGSCGLESCKGTVCKCVIEFDLDFPRLSDFSDTHDLSNDRPFHQAGEETAYSAVLEVEGRRFLLDRPIHDSGTRYWTLQDW